MKNNLPDNHIESFLMQKRREFFNARLASFFYLHPHQHTAPTFPTIYTLTGTVPPLPHSPLNNAWQAARVCDTFMVLGSSLQVYPAAQIPITAKENGAVLMIINLDETPLDHKAEMVIHGKASEVLAGRIGTRS